MATKAATTRSRRARPSARGQLRLDELAAVDRRTLAEEVESAFLEYSMSVIVSRALPDVRDGLKPVHRRILWSMFQAGHRPDRPFVKCARVVGDVMGRYHPHGDAAIYEALVRMGQDFSLSNVLVDKHGNFGSPSDPPAAARYTEVRLSPLAMDLLDAIDEGTVDLEANYDGTAEEPAVLPARFPNLLVNGTQGIAVGMATNIPPHNLTEVCNAALRLLAKPDATLSELMRHVKGPDFPTGGLILGDEGIKDAYRTGRGTLRLRAVTEIEETRRGTAIVVTEVPYQTSVDAIAGRLAEAVEAGKIQGVRDIRNESGAGATRLVIELRPEANPQVVLANLYKHTPAQTTFPVNVVALVDGVPRTLPLVETLQHWIQHQEEVVTRRSRFRLQKAEDRLHIVEGLIAAIDKIDAIVKLIRRSANRGAAREALMKAPFGFTEVQANYILDMPLGRITRLGEEELAGEAKQLRTAIKRLKQILGNRTVLREVITEELTEIRDRFPGKRVTQIVAGETGAIDTTELVVDEDVIVTVTARGHVKATPARVKGKKVPAPGAKDALAAVANTRSLASVLFLTDRGRAFRIPVHDLPADRLTAPQTMFQFGDGEQVVAVMPSDWADDFEHLVFVTEQGGVKRVPFSEYVDVAVRRDGVVAIKLGAGDRVVSVYPGWDEYEALLVTAEGQAIRFPEAEIRVVGRAAGTIRGIRLRAGDRVVGGCAVASEEAVVLATTQGHAKRVRVDDFPLQARGGAGVKALKREQKRGPVAAVAALGEEMTFVTTDGVVTVANTSIRLAGREATGTEIDDFPGGAVIRVLPHPVLPPD
jgi:DNA gyrase subunit A